MNIPSDVGDHINALVESLPVLASEDILDIEDSCPICLMSFSSLVSDANIGEGVTKLVACNHIFCRKDLTRWILSLHGNCPTCRHKFLDVQLPSESDDESSDGGEYIPDVDFDEDDDGFVDTDGFSDVDIGTEMDEAGEWEDGVSEGDIVMNDMDDIDQVDANTEWRFADEESSLSEAAEISGALDLVGGSRDTVHGGVNCNSFVESERENSK